MPASASTFAELARRKQIVSTAMQTLAEIGYPRASLEQIAKRAGISRSLINYHFASKEGLIEQVLATVYADGANYLADRMPDPTACATTMLTSYIRANIAFIREHPTHIAAAYAIVTNWRGGSPLIEPDDDAATARTAHLQTILAQGQHDGEFRMFDRGAMATAIIQAIEGAHRSTATDPALNLDAYADELVTLFHLATTAPEHTTTDAQCPES